MTRSFSKECDSKCSAKSRALIGFFSDIWLIMPEYHDEIIGKLYHWDMAQYSSICIWVTWVLWWLEYFVIWQECMWQYWVFEEALVRYLQLAHTCRLLRHVTAALSGFCSLSCDRGPVPKTQLCANNLPNHFTTDALGCLYNVHIRPFRCRELCKIPPAECLVLWQNTRPATPASVAQALYMPYHST